MTTTLPEPWPELIANGFHNDLVVRATKYYEAMQEMGKEDVATEVLTHFGDGFTRSFDAEKYKPAEDDPDYQLKLDLLSALEELSEQFGNRVSTVVWDAYAYLATRPAPKDKATILSQKEYLPVPYWVADICYHGVGMVYSLMRHIDTVTTRKANVVFTHNCDCSCSAQAVSGGGVNVPMADDEVTEATAAVFTHILKESLPLRAHGWPFVFGLSPESREAVAAGLF